MENIMLFLSEHTLGSRTTHIFQRLTEQDYVVFCFYCGNEAVSESFPTEYDADHWAMKWLNQEEHLSTEQPTVTRGCCD